MSDAFDLTSRASLALQLIYRGKKTRPIPPGLKTTHLRGIFYNLCLFVLTQTVNILQYYLLYNSVEMTGFEPVTFALQRRCSPAELHPQNLLGLVGLTGFEPVTPALSAQCSNQLSYKPGLSP